VLCSNAEASDNGWLDLYTVGFISDCVLILREILNCLIASYLFVIAFFGLFQPLLVQVLRVKSTCVIQLRFWPYYFTSRW